MAENFFSLGVFFFFFYSYPGNNDFPKRMLSGLLFPGEEAPLYSRLSP